MKDNLPSCMYLTYVFVLKMLKKCPIQIICYLGLSPLFKVLKQFHFIFYLRKFYGDIQLFQLKIFNCSSLLESLVDLCNRDKEKNASNTSGYEYFFSFSIHQIPNFVWIFSISNRGVRAPLFEHRGGRAPRRPPLSYDPCSRGS